MGQLWLGVGLIVLGSLITSPPIVLLGLVLAVADAVRAAWARRGVAYVEYRRTLGQRHAVAGDELPLDITVWNRSPAPVAWLRAVDIVSEGVVVREREVAGADTAALRNTWTLAGFERVTRHFHVVAARRGVYAIGPVRLEAGDPLARAAAAGELAGLERWIVRPRMVRVVLAERDDPWGVERRARHGLVDEPTRYAGTRPYQPGDPARRIHWRATARLGTPVTRTYEPGRHREVVVVLDVQTTEGSRWQMDPDGEAVEDLCVAAASIVRRLLVDGASVGLAAAGYTLSTRPFAYAAPDASPAQLERCLDLLARLGPLPSIELERMVTALLRAIRPGTSLVVVGMRDPVAVMPALRRTAALGHPVQLLTLGEIGPAASARARTAGIDARAVQLDGPWQTATALVVA